MQSRYGDGLPSGVRGTWPSEGFRVGHAWWPTAPSSTTLYVGPGGDSNDNGYGDLRAFIARLDHLAWLGVDAIRLSPTMPSPDEEGGYTSVNTPRPPRARTLARPGRSVIETGRPAGHEGDDQLVADHTARRIPWFDDDRSGREAARPTNW